MSGKTPRVLLIAEAANPEWTSVPLVGWSLATALAKIVDAHIVTQIRNRDAFIRAGLVEGTDFTAIDSEALAAPLWRAAEVLRMGKGKGWTTTTAISRLSYPYFEHLVWKQFSPAIESGEFDIVHRITPLSPTITSPIAAKCRRAGAAFVLGPLNGGAPWPKGFDAERRREREWLSYVRGAYKFLPGRRATLASANLILVGSRHTESEIPSRYRTKCSYMPENAVDLDRFNKRAELRPDGPLRVCFVGRLVPYKGPDMLIEAMAPLLQSGMANLDVIGDGPLARPLKDMIKRYGIEESVTLHGWINHKNVQNILAQSHVFGFPSVREFGGGVILEAMAVGVPPLVIDYAGPGELVDDAVGFKVPIGSRAEIIESFRRVLSDIVVSRTALSTLGKQAQTRVTERHTWEKKALCIVAFYNTIRQAGNSDEISVQ